MKIERVDHKTVKCFLSNEELDAYQITYKDFLSRSEKAKEVLEDIMGRAGEAVGYQPPKCSFDLQVMLLPDRGMVLTFSEKEPGEISMADTLAECLREMRQLFRDQPGQAIEQIPSMEQISSMEKATPPEGADAARTQLPKSGAKRGRKSHDLEKGQGAKERQPENESKLPRRMIYSFASLGNLCAYAAALPDGLHMKSRLYQMDGRYYLCLEKGRTAIAKYRQICIQALEFGTLYTADPRRWIFLEEHADCLLAQGALEKLGRDV
ncbi:MAG: adaptor protein MecA [Clostridium sp.]|jgi:negative regulator of genetic competence, sporulation and motility|nr:adaptor protein MecA [Clostridium sp.]